MSKNNEEIQSLEINILSANFLRNMGIWTK